MKKNLFLIQYMSLKIENKEFLVAGDQANSLEMAIEDI